MSPRDKNKEGLKDPPSREAREKEVPVGSIRDPKRAEAGAEIRPGRAQEQEQSQNRGAQTNSTRSSSTPSQLTTLTQRKEGKRSIYCKEFLEGVRKKIRKEIYKEDIGILNLRKKAQERDTYLSGGAGGEYKAAHREIQAREEERYLELDGVVEGLERALVIINIAEEEQGQPASHPGPRAHSEQPSPGRKPQKGQNKVDDKLLIDGEGNMSEEIEEDQEEESMREAQNAEGTQAQDKPTIEEL